MSDTFPRQYARTRRFSLGTPRNLTVSPDGERVVFLRSASGEDPRTSLWVLEVATGEETLVIDASSSTGPVSMTGAERALRERTRESAEGVTAYSTDRTVDRVACLHRGSLVVADLSSGGVETLECEAGAFGPVVSPDGAHVAYVSGTGLRVTGPGDPDRLLIDEDSPTVSWGQAEFIAAEEMGRTRGFWWSPESDRLAVARVDVAPVTAWWISHPVDPARAPTAIRYPAAGGANATVGLSLIGLDGSRTDVKWDPGEWEYLAAVRWTDEGLQVTLQSRDQRRLLFARVDPRTGDIETLADLSDPLWVELVPGVPVLAGGRPVTVEEVDGSRRLCVDRVPVTPVDMWVRGVADTDAERIVFTASVEPTRVGVYEYRLAGDELVAVTRTPGVHSVAAGGATLAVTSRTLERWGARVEVLGREGPRRTIEDLSVRPLVEPRPEMLRTADNDIRVAVLWPNRPHEGPLPILLDPYGGPHAQRVLASFNSFLVSQWFADQGFAVVVADGRGTPGRGDGWERAVAGDLAGPVLEDQVEALLTVVDRYGDRVDPSRVAVRGWSFGGYLAALAVLRRPDVFAAAIAGAPVTDWALYDTHYTERYLGTPSEQPEAYRRSSLVDEAHRLERPLMLIHGLADDNVVAAHTLRLSRALLESGRPHEVLPLSGVTHMTPQEEVAENLLILQVDFLRRSLGRGTPGEATTPMA